MGSASTTWGWRKVKISPRPEGHTGASPQASALQKLSPRNPREPLTITVRRLGGNECWWELKARGVTLKYPGHLCIEDVLTWVYEGGGSLPRD